MTKTATAPETSVPATAELLPSERLENIAKMQKKLQDALAAAKKAEQDYADTVQAEQQKLLDQVKAFEELIGKTTATVAPVKTDPVQVNVVAPDNTDTKTDTKATEITTAPLFATLAEVLPVSAPVAKSITVEPAKEVLAAPVTDSKYWVIPENVEMVLRYAAVIVIVAIMFSTLIWLAQLLGPRESSPDSNVKQMKIIDEVLANTVLTQNEKYALAAQRLYQEYYADNGTGTDEEKREQARLFALKYVPPMPQSNEQVEQLLQKVQQLETQIETRINAPPQNTSAPLWDGSVPDVLKDEVPKPEIKPDVKPEPKTIPRRTPLFRQRADGTFEPVPLMEGQSPHRQWLSLQYLVYQCQHPLNLSTPQ